ncbi:prepilin peptidase [Mangrovicoccus sp. HB161399]|uniref:preprotein translocase subunit SecA n=1 Tax=Mangrovicoccus sp. HB161399 TaxID=2720392 RepID=UPI001553C80E|nr:prepilin peptidase [Mangrovicoccus sp. HB161399]
MDPALHHPRPGPVFGAYPQREDERLPMLDRMLAGLEGGMRRLGNRLPMGRRGFLQAVARHEARLGALMPHEFRAEASAIRGELNRRGLHAAGIAQAFAATRVAAIRTLGMRHFDVQLTGGRILLSGRIAEMDTGEGKTLTATLPAVAAAFAGIPVHVVTVNDFLAGRDAGTMAPLYEALGLSTGLVLEGMGAEERRAAYGCDICYVTNKQLAFDYLKDRLILERETRKLHLDVEGLKDGTPRTGRALMRGLCFAIVDEADSCLIDEARTPLVISRPGDLSGMEETYRQAVSLARRLQAPRDFVISARDRRITVTDLGKAQIRWLSERWGGVWAAEVHREELAQQALTALHLYERDKHYILREGTIQIVDEYTGRIMGDRKWERGLHQMIEVKERVEITGRNETLARISYQRFFRRYLKVSGMTGTARELSGEFWSVYRLMVTRVPTNRPSRRRAEPRRHFATEAQKWQAIAARVADIHATGRPVLIGTRSVAASETLSDILAERGLRHRVLNARQDEHEAEIVAEAGQPGQITLATNMAGRGTDIKLGAGVAGAGGLFVLGSELHDSARIDRQLYGRCGRQGDPGGYAMMPSFEDEIIRETFGPRTARLASRLAGPGGEVPGLLARPVFRIAQAAAERRNSRLRRSLLKYDDTIDDLLAFSGQTE